MPNARAASASKISSTTCTSRKWLPEPSVPSWCGPRSLARSLTLVGVGAGQAPPPSVRSRSCRPAVALLDRPARRPSTSTRSSSCASTRIWPRAAHAGGHVAEQLVHQRRQVAAATSSSREVGAQQPHAAVDVVADAAGRDHAARRWIGRRHAADGEAVAPVDVRHGQRVADDARQEGHVGHLLEGLVLRQDVHHLLAGVDAAGDAHPLLVAAGQLPAQVIDPLQYLLPVLRHLTPPLGFSVLGSRFRYPATPAPDSPPALPRPPACGGLSP